MATAATSIESATASVTRPGWLGRINVGRLFAHLALLLLVLVWTMPTAGLMISSLRDKDLLTTSGWWTALGTA